MREKIDSEIIECDQQAGSLDSAIDSLGNTRGVNICTQFLAIFQRNVQYVTRNPRTLHGVAFQGAFMGVILLLLYNGIGTSFTDYDKVATDPYFAAKYQ